MTATNSVATIAVGASPVGVTVDEQTNFIYVANAGNSQTGDPGSITVIDGKTNALTTLADSNGRSDYRAAIPMAKSICGTTDRFHPARMFGPHHRME